MWQDKISWSPGKELWRTKTTRKIRGRWWLELMSPNVSLHLSLYICQYSTSMLPVTRIYMYFAPITHTNHKLTASMSVHLYGDQGPPLTNRNWLYQHPYHLFPYSYAHQSKLRSYILKEGFCIIRPVSSCPLILIKPMYQIHNTLYGAPFSSLVHMFHFPIPTRTNHV